MTSSLISPEARARYAERRQADLQICRQSLDKKDFSALETVGHNLKGNGISFGYPELSELGALLEKSAKTADYSKAQQCLNELESWIGKNRLNS